MEKITPAELADRAPKFKIFDIRKKPDDRKIPGAMRAEGEALEAGGELPFERNEDVVLYCGSGNSCSRIAQALRERGYRAVALEGGYKGWVDAGLPTEVR